ncbi:MAG TPA: hypothetical protein VFL92_08225, partial [Sphingomonas sp.]|nr:hypothetical protein [Sphingomonas sp.]
MSMTLAIALALASTTPAALPQQQDPFTAAAPLPEEQVAMPEIRAAFGAGDPKEMIDHFDRALAQLPQPTRLRGVVQCLRGTTLNALERKAEAEAAIDECYRLDPDLPFAQLVYAWKLDETGDLRGAVRMFAKAVTESPATVSRLPVDVVETMLRRLQYDSDSALRQQLILALVNAGYGQNDPAFFSSLARETMASRLAAGDIAGARALIPAVTDPADGLKMLIDRTY